VNDEGLLAEQRAYYRARAPEYDEWWQRRGRYDRGSDLAEEWDRQVAQVAAALDTFGAPVTPVYPHPDTVRGWSCSALLEPSAGSWSHWALFSYSAGFDLSSGEPNSRSEQARDLLSQSTQTPVGGSRTSAQAGCRCEVRAGSPLRTAVHVVRFCSPSQSTKGPTLLGEWRTP
jgi:hypothetical protein